MTRIIFYRKNGQFYGFSEKGHTGYGESGDDILCSALSAMTMLIINSIEISYACDVEYEIDDATADITVKCKSALPEFEKNEAKRFAVEGLFKGYYYQLNDLIEEYGDFLDVDVVDE